MNEAFHYPPELMNLLIDTIPLLNRSKRDVLLFFMGCGVPYILLDEFMERLINDKESVNKYEITRHVLTKLNERGDRSIKERREIIKRIVEFEDYSTCWPNDQMKAKGYVAEIRKVVNIKDSFTRMALERESEKRKRQEEYLARVEKERAKKDEIENIKKNLYALFGETNPQKRGKTLEGILNRLFLANGILVREAFTLIGDEGEGIVEQIDGVVELDGNLFLVEMKWLKDPVGVQDISRHIVRVFGREGSRGVYISASGFTKPAIDASKDALSRVVFVLVHLEEIVMVLEKCGDLKDFLRQKVQKTIIEKEPL